MNRLARFTVLVLFVIAIPLQAQSHPEGEAAWATLMQGNASFAQSNQISFGDLLNRRAARQSPERPKVAVVACADSRVPPEFIFKQNLLDVFVIRTAGNIVDPFALASLEYAGGPPNNWLRLIVVVGHSDCGAVTEALKPADPGSPNLDALLTRIRESFSFPYKPENLQRAIEANALNVSNYIPAHSTILRDKTEITGPGGILIVAAYHDLATGTVRRLR